MGGSGRVSSSSEEDGGEEKKDTRRMTLTYASNLQREIQALARRKEELLSSSQTISSSSSSTTTPSFSVDTMELGNREILIQITTLRLANNTSLIIPIAQVIRAVEQEDGLLLMEVSTFESSYGRIFHNLHIQVEAEHEINYELLKEKILKEIFTHVDLV